MNTQFSNRIHNVPRSFIREILKTASEKDVISFAGGLPNPLLFPINDLKEATNETFNKYGPEALQYSNSEGSVELRNHISDYYKEKGMNMPIGQILITSGSQQALDLLGKVFINEKDKIIIEEPGYLGAIQAFSMYKPEFLPVPISEDGLDCNTLEEHLKSSSIKLIYTVPNFQNPSGLSYSLDNRIAVANILRNTGILLIEDNPYGELRYKGIPMPCFKTLLPDQTIMLGTFSKTVVPSFRLGWIVAPPEIMEKIIIAKQAADLHTNFFCQLVLAQYFKLFDNKAHVLKVSKAYGKQRDTMIKAIEKYFPNTVKYTKPEGGMFLWVTLPEGQSSMKLLELTSKEKVIFVPGNQFYTNRTGDVNTFRLNFSCSDEETIEKGIRIIGNAIREMCQ